MLLCEGSSGGMKIGSKFFLSPTGFHYLQKAEARSLLILQAVALWLRFSPFLELLGRQTVTCCPAGLWAA